MQKLYYSISEISKLVDEEQHILRYWEKNFNLIKPRKNRAGNRVYSEKDLNIIKSIKYLIREEKLSLAGAKEKLSTMNFDVDETKTEQLFDEPSIEIEETEIITEEPVYVENNSKQLLLEIRGLLVELKAVMNN